MTSPFDAASPAAQATPLLSLEPPGRPSIAVVPGSYDPITLGHRDVILRAATLFDRVVVAVGANQDKSPLFDLATRLELIKASLPLEPRIEVAAVPGLLADFCRQRGAHAIVKGLRGGSDLEHEEPMALVNRDQAALETIFLPASPAYGYVSSSIVRDVARHGGQVGRYVTEAVEAALKKVAI
ncbi:MAG: pantetheine-phosphate adenylyltransferase [Micrococcales bacterium]|nr:pantetheine-phosphate adenylyltransferase [Micrococcales bacterium]